MKKIKTALIIIMAFIISLPIYLYLFIYALNMVGYKPHDGTAVTAGGFALATAILFAAYSENE